MFRLGAGAEQDTEAHPVGYGVQQRLAGIQATARVIEIRPMGVQQAEIAQKLTFAASIPHRARDGQRRLEVIPGLVEPSQALVGHSEVAQHEALQLGIAHVSRHRQRGPELIEGFTEPSLHLMQQTEVAQRVPFEPPIANLPCHGKRGFMVRSRLVHDPHLGVFVTQIAEYAALPMPVPRFPRQGQCRVVRRKSLFPPAQNRLHVTEHVVGVALNAPIVQFTCDGQRHLDACTGRFQAAFLDMQKAEAHKRTTLASRSPPSRAPACDASNRMRASGPFPEYSQCTSSNIVHPGGSRCSDFGDGPHQRRQFDSDLEGSAQAQPRPRAFQRAHGHIDVASRRGAATSHDEIVELGAAIGDRGLLVQTRKVRAVSRFRCEQRGGSAPHVASLRAQVLRCILLHAHEEIEASVGHLSDQ